MVYFKNLFVKDLYIFYISLYKINIYAKYILLYRPMSCLLTITQKIWARYELEKGHVWDVGGRVSSVMRFGNICQVIRCNHDLLLTPTDYLKQKGSFSEHVNILNNPYILICCFAAICYGNALLINNTCGLEMEFRWKRNEKLHKLVFCNHKVISS